MNDFLLAITVFIGIVVIFAILSAFPLMILWNWLMPVIFGLPIIDFWQALGLCVLSSVLFKSSTTSKRD